MTAPIATCWKTKRTGSPPTCWSHRTALPGLPGSQPIETLRDFAQEIGIAPGIVVGRLQHDGHWGWNRGHKLKRGLRIVDSDLRPPGTSPPPPQAWPWRRRRSWRNCLPLALGKAVLRGSADRVRARVGRELAAWPGPEYRLADVTPRSLTGPCTAPCGTAPRARHHPARVAAARLGSAVTSGRHPVAVWSRCQPGRGSRPGPAAG